MKYSKNENYFERIDTESKAYFLGLLFADGWISKNRLDEDKIITRNQICISLIKTDGYILQKFLDELNSNHMLYLIEHSKKNPKWHDQLNVTISSSKMKNDLKKLGCIENKTSILQFPSINKEFVRHFIRGYFDGDGSIWIGERKKFIFNDNSIGKRRERIIHNMKFNFTGNYNFIKKLQDILIEEIKLNKVKINNHSVSKSVQLEYSGRNNIIKFHDYIYKDATVFLHRKKDIFNKVICANI